MVSNEKKIVISFDDGHISDVKTALPLLSKYGFTAEFFVTTDWIGGPNYLAETDIRTLSDAKMGIGSHGASHRFFNDMSYEEAATELENSLSRLREITGKPINRFSAPGGRLPAKLPALAKEHSIELICTSAIGMSSASNFPNKIPRFAIRRDLSMSDFIKIVNGDRAFYRRQHLRHIILVSIRTLLGNSFYMSLREKLMAARKAKV